MGWSSELIWQDAPQGEIPVRFRVSKKHSIGCFLLTACNTEIFPRYGRVQRLAIFKAQIKNVLSLHQAEAGEPPDKQFHPAEQ